MEIKITIQRQLVICKDEEQNILSCDALLMNKLGKRHDIVLDFTGRDTGAWESSSENE